MSKQTPNRLTLAIATLALLGGLAAGAQLVPGGASASADAIAANRMSASGSGIEILSVPLTEGESSEVHTVLTGKVKLSTPYDLIFRVTAECALWTDVSVTGDADSESIASVKLWVEVDGMAVPVAADDTGEDAGKVVFCNRAFRMVTHNFGENQTIDTFLRTRSANSFNWFTAGVSDAGGIVHTIEVKAQLESKVTGVGQAQAGIGKRTLVVEPVKFGTNL